jgi:hypothetical protein
VRERAAERRDELHRRRRRLCWLLRRRRHLLISTGFGYDLEGSNAVGFFFVCVCVCWRVRN